MSLERRIAGVGVVEQRQGRPPDLADRALASGQRQASKGRDAFVCVERRQQDLVVRCRPAVDLVAGDRAAAVRGRGGPGETDGPVAGRCRGEGRGAGANRNFPLTRGTDNERYLRSFDRALEWIARGGVEGIVLSLGFDLLRGDPTGSFMLTPDVLRRIGRRLVATGLPLLVVQEGGYNLRNIRRGSAAFFRGCAEASPGV